PGAIAVDAQRLAKGPLLHAGEEAVDGRAARRVRVAGEDDVGARLERHQIGGERAVAGVLVERLLEPGDGGEAGSEREGGLHAERERAPTRRGLPGERAHD